METVKTGIIAGNCMEVLKTLPSDSVDCVITSPPYYLMRRYGTECVWGGDPNCNHQWSSMPVLHQRGSPSTAQVGNSRRGVCPRDIHQGRLCRHCGAWKGELGHEPTVDMFVSHLADVFDEVRRILKNTGNCFVVIGDTYRQKQLQMVPFRLAVEMQTRGWFIRDIAIWAKKVTFVDRNGTAVETAGNGMPESASDRLTRSWEAVIHATKSQDYCFLKPDVVLKTQSVQRAMRECSSEHRYVLFPEYGGGSPQNRRFCGARGGDGLNRPKPNVRQILSSVESKQSAEAGSINRFGTRPFVVVRSGDEETLSLAEDALSVSLYLRQALNRAGLSLEDLASLTGADRDVLSHYFRVDVTGAALPSRSAWQVLSEHLGLQDYDEVVKPEYRKILPVIGLTASATNVLQVNLNPSRLNHFAAYPEGLVRFLLEAGCPKQVCPACGRPECSCGVCRVPAVVLDPFLGSGTTALVAEETGRRWIGIEMNPEYVKIAEERLRGVQRTLF